MKLLEVKSLRIESVKVIRYGHYCDNRGYFTETFRKSDIAREVNCGAISGSDIVQINESASKKYVMRGLHFQWNPFMGKLVRTIEGHMIDMFLDIRKGSPTYGKIALYNMPNRESRDYTEWIWVPPGFAHGNFFLAEYNKIEYLCTGEYSEGCEGVISPLAYDLDWKLCDKRLKKLFDSTVGSNDLIISDKDRYGNSLREWTKRAESNYFIFEKV